MNMKKNDPYDLCACYESSEDVPGDREPTMTDLAMYIIDEAGVEYFCCGNTKVKVTEHFAENGKMIDELMTDLILREAKKKREV